MKRLGEWLRTKRTQRRWTQSQLAHRLETEGACVSRWERGVNRPSLEQFRKLCIAFGASADDGLELPKRCTSSAAAVSDG
jgi:transcriptional regulator with XRE-family HTH domain